MHREGYIIEEIVEYDNFSLAFDTVLSGRKRKKSRTGRNLIANKEKRKSPSTCLK